MTTAQETRIAPCPGCKKAFERPVARLNGNEIFASAEVLCPACTSIQAVAPPPIPADLFEIAWRDRLPAEYRAADPARVPARLRPLLTWTPQAFQHGLGVVSPPGIGKSMAVACLLRLRRERFFRWFNGSAIRSLAIRVATAEIGLERSRLESEWASLYRAGILVLDDVDKARFTEAWVDRLFDLLEQRRNRLLPTFWTANMPPAALTEKIARSIHDRDSAQAIERRLCAGAMVMIL